MHASTMGERRISHSGSKAFFAEAENTTLQKIISPLAMRDRRSNSLQGRMEWTSMRETNKVMEIVAIQSFLATIY